MEEVSADVRRYTLAPSPAPKLLSKFDAVISIGIISVVFLQLTSSLIWIAFAAFVLARVLYYRAQVKEGEIGWLTIAETLQNP